MKICKNKIAIVGDLHLGLHQSNNMWHDISLDFAQWLKQTLTDKGIKDIVMLGDVLDNRNEVSVTTLHTLSKFFKALEDFNIIIITGNHDCYYSKRSDVHSIGTLSDWTNIEVVDKLLTVNMFNKTLSFCPWNTQPVDIPKSDIILGHFEINTFKMNGMHVCEHGVDSQALLDKAPLILSGHFHCTDDRNYKNGRILYAGSPYEQSWGEAGDPKGIYLLDLHDDALEFIENTKSPKHIKLRLSELLALGKITDNIKKEFQGNIITFVIDVEIEQKAIDALLVKFYALNPLSIKTENVLYAQNTISFDEEIKFEGVDIKKDIVEFIDKMINDVENKDNLINYLMTVYDQCKEAKK
jgi:DNA repair exonuclease SbcCD nuclease subunit